MATAPPINRPGGPSRASLDTANEKEEEKTAVSAIQESGSDSASDIRIEEADSIANGLPGSRQLPDEKVDPAALEIEYRYFTFETPLPPPNTISSSSPSTGSAVDALPEPSPPPPDLKPYADPHTWPNRRKNLMLGMSCVATFLTAYSAGAFSTPADRMAEAFGVSLLIIQFAGITVFCMGFALAPMLLAPLSEYNGRYPVFVVAGSVFVIFQAVTGASTDVAAVLISRLLVGVGGSVFSTMVGGVIADMWHAEGRNRPMTLFSGAVLFATGSGPLVSSIITYHAIYPQNPNDVLTDPSPRAPWRWVFWHQVILDGVFMVCLVLFFYESRGSVLLSRKAKALNKWYDDRERVGYFGVWIKDGDAEVKQPPADQQVEGHEEDDKKEAAEKTLGATPPPLQNGPSSSPQSRHSTLLSAGEPPRSRLRRVRWVVKDDEGRTTVLRMMAMSVSRPFHMFFTEPVVFFFSLWVAFAWAILYLMFGSIFLVFEEVYDFDMQQAGLAFVPLLVAAVLSTVMGLYQDRVFYALLPRRHHARFPPDVPEARLYVACFTSVLLPAGLFLFGFAARPDVHWIVPMVGIGLSTVGIFAVYLATFNYLADVYHRFASSALAAQSCARNLLGGVFPLVMRALFTNLGNARAGALLGGIATGLTFVPWVLVFFGEAIRRRSRFAMSLEQ